VDKWWQAQPEDATMSAYRLATCFGIPVSKITAGQNEHLLLILRVAVTLTSWLSKVLKTTRSMTSIMSALTLCKHQIGILASLSPLTLSSSINLFFAYRILQTRLMMLYVLHYPQANGKLVAILRGATCTRHLYGTTLLAHQQFSRSFFEPNAVYLRFTCIAKHQPLFYIGSTEDHTLGREHTRYRKFKQVSSGQFVLSELAIRFWSHSNNFFWWSPVPLYIRRANHWALEHALIQLWQPKLNYPFISQFFIPRKGIISKIPYSNTRQFGIASLWRKRRYKTTGKALRNILNSSLFQNRVRMWALLQDLGSNTRRRFEQTQYIRSSAFNLEGCHALRRLGVHLPETHQKLALQAIDGAIHFRKGKAIGKVCPFRAPWMLSRHLDSHVRQILRLWYFGFAHTAVPCHEPSFRLIYVKHPSLMEAICNHKEAIQNWSDEITPTCTCSILRQYPTARAFPNLKCKHWVLDGALLAPLLPDRLAQIAGGSLNNKIFPNTKELQRLFLEAFHTWAKLNAIPCPTDEWILQQISPILADHSRRITNHITAATTRQLQEQFADCIFHNEDKRASSLRIFCPCQYFQCIEKTFLDSAIFARTPENPGDCLHITMQHLKNQFAKDYPWAMGKGKSLPAGYILPKGKKQYGSGRHRWLLQRPIQTNVEHFGQTSFSVGSCPEHFARGDVYQLLKLLREKATTMADKDLRIYNQDLSGFFISIDSDRFLASWYMLLRFLEPSMSVHENEFFSVSPVKQNNPGDIIKGRTFRTLNVNRHIRIGDIPELIIAALQMQNFQLGSKVYTQVQGSPMGSPLSPALCLMVVSVYEQIWFHTHRESISNLHLNALFLRYVDHRPVILPSSTKHLAAFQVLVDPNFYKAPIILETEPDPEFLGFQLELDPFELCYQPPQDLSQVLSPMSASPPAVLLSGFASRCSIVHRGSYPKAQVDKGIYMLKRPYVRAGFKEEDLNKIVKRVLKQREKMICRALPCPLLSFQDCILT